MNPPNTVLRSGLGVSGTVGTDAGFVTRTGVALTLSVRSDAIR